MQQQQQDQQEQVVHVMPSLLGAAAADGNLMMQDPEAANQAAQVVTKEEPNTAGVENKDGGGGANNENSVISFWSSSNSDSDDFNDANKNDAADQTTRRGKKGHGRSRRRRSPGSDKNHANSGSEERKEYKNDGGRRGRRSRSRDNSADPKKSAISGVNTGVAGGDPSAVDPDAEEKPGHHRRERSNGGSPFSRGSSQDRGGNGRYDGHRRGSNQRKDIGTMGQSSNQRGANSSFRRGGKRDGGDFNTKGFFFPSMSKPLVSLQQFSSLQTRQSDLYAIKSQYKIYMTQHKEKHASAFWKEHEKEPWFMETYNPMTVYQIQLEAQLLIQAKANAFFSKIPYDLLDLTKRDDMATLEGPQLQKFDQNSRTLYLKQIPTFVSRVQLREAVESMTKGLETIIFSRPLQMNNFDRFAWLVYATEEQAEAAIPDLQTLVIRAPAETQIEDFKLSPIKNNQSVKQPKVTPNMPLDHVNRDIDLCKRLIKEIFDVEKEIEFPFERLETEIESQDAKLDTLLLYLRRVHGFCFFCGFKCEDERQLAGKCASQHLRQTPSIERVIFDSSALHGSARQFEQNYIQQAEKLLAKGPDEKLKDPQQDELLVEAKNQYCLDKTKEVEVLKTQFGQFESAPEVEVLEGYKYVCKVCDKAFRSTEFVVKHIKNKHEDRLLRQNYSYFKREARENFLNELKKTQDAKQYEQLQNSQSFGNQSGHGNLTREGSIGGSSGYFNKGGRNDDGSNNDNQGYNNNREGGRNRGSDSFNRGGYRSNFEGGRGKPRGMMGSNSGYMGNQNQGSNDGNGGDNMMGGGSMDIDGDKHGKGAAQPQREYIDYDDPTQFDREGQRITGLNAAAAAQSQLQQQIQQQQQQLLLKNSSVQAQEKDRQIVSYDDLF